MCFRKWGSLVGGVILSNRLIALREKEKFGGSCFVVSREFLLWEPVSFVRKCKSSGFPQTKHLINLKVSISSHHFDVMPSNGFTLIFYQPTPISHFRRAKNNVQFPFLSTVCGGKHALQLQFSSKPDSASYQKFPFCTGSKRGRAYRGSNKLLQKNLMRRTFQILLKISPHGFWTEVAGR